MSRREVVIRVSVGDADTPEKAEDGVRDLLQNWDCCDIRVLEVRASDRVIEDDDNECEDL